MQKEQLFLNFSQLIASIILADDVIEESESDFLENSIGSHPSSQIIKNLIDSREKNSLIENYKYIRDFYKENSLDEDFHFMHSALNQLSHISKMEESEDEELVHSFYEGLNSILSVRSN